ncbi:amino acid adenylation domain-containing protein [Pseudomonas sp. B11D7D]|nr:non-ribosomal peptide synthetase [Pseudomonas sp. B11D7D]QNH03777.1 amino acid adenylation domain-containing protein [Pseudomonas sp. B11D7D]
MSNIEDIYSLSPTQHGLLFHSVYEPDSRVYYQQLSLDMTGPLDTGAFRRAWQALMQRHAVLRTAFLWEDLDDAYQVVQHEVPLPLSELDWRDRDEVEEALRQCARQERDQALELNDAPLMRLCLVRLPEQRWHLIWTFHHILMDGWSVGVAIQEWLALYYQQVRGDSAGLPPSRSYRDYIAWLAEQDVQATEHFWREQLQDFSEPTPLPSFAPPPEAPQAHPYAERETRLDAAETERLNQFARSQHLTVNTLIQGAWALLLGQHAGRDEVVYGVTVAGRPDGLAGVDSMVGLFINTLPLRVRLDDSRTLGDWLQDLQHCNSDLRQHAYLPLSRLKPLSQVPAERALFDSILVFENFPVTDALNQDTEGLRFSAPPEQRRADGIRLTQGRNHFPLSLIVVPGERLEYLFSYDRSRFSDAEIALLSAQLRALLLAMAEQPQARLQTLDWLSAEERLRLQDHGQGAHLAVAASTLQQRFVSGAKRHPERLAVQDRRRALSYAELDAESNRLAHRLQNQGIGSGQLLALALERSVDFVVALLATLKCGAAYLPLDLKQPAGRLADILQDSRADLLISQRALQSRLPRSESPARLWLDDEAATLATLLSTPVSAGDDEDAPAYVIYTSGSTGTPKGVVIEHRAIVGYLAAVAELLDPPPAARYGLLSTVAADLGHTQLFGALCSGGSLILVDEDTSFDPPALADFFGKHPVDVLKITPGHLQGLLQAHPDPRLLPRERLVFGGDALKPELLRQVAALAPTLRLFNHYGPSEATVGALATPLTADTNLVALGRPLANRRLRVADDNGRQVAIGVPGELWIAGDLARGYLHRDDLTAKHFIENDGQRWYRTGDRVRWLADGQLAFLGRVDNQVKIRGNRLELGEVEAQIRRLSPLIEQALVRVLEVDGTPRLVAYVVASQSLSASKLCDDLSRRVPDYMVPAHVITLDAIPLTANGKVDIRQLPLPTAPASDNANHVAPRNEVETLLARIWQDVLKVERIGVHDNFFSLGGDSILNLQIIARANQQGLKLTPKQLFENRTIADIAQVLGAGAESAAARQQGDGFAIALSAGQRARLEVGALQPSWRCLNIDGALSTEHLAQALAVLQGHHQALRLALQNTADGQWQQRVLASPAPLEVSEQPQTDEPLTALAEAAFARLDLAAGQSLNTSLLRGATGDRLLLVAHPLCCDEAAWPLLLADLNLALAQLRYQRPIRLSYTGGELAAWCEHQQQDASSERLDEVWEHWLQFADLELPALDISGLPDAQAELRLDATTSTQLKRLLETLQLDWESLLASSLVERLAGAGSATVALTLQSGRPDATRLPLQTPISLADLDPARILGTLTVPVPFYLQAPSGDAVARLQDVAAQLHSYPQFGADYGTLRYLADNPYLLEPLRQLPVPAVALRWLGDWDAHREARTVLAGIQAANHEPALAEALSLDACWHGGALLLTATGPLASTWLPALAAHLQTLASLADSPDLRPAGTAFPLCQAQVATLASEPLPWARLEDLYPLSPMQQGMLLHTLLQPHSGIYLMQQRYSWDGELQRPAMEQAWRLFLDRHPMLRTAFWWQEDHEPLQCVYRDTELAFEWYDWRHLDAEQQREAMDAVLADERQRGFDMSRAPLTYLRVFQLAEQRFSMVRSFHHILTDAWCFGLLMEDLLAIYQALARDEAVARPRWRPFRGYMSWLTRQDMATAQGFWRNELAGFEAPTPLQVDLPVAQQDQAPELVGDCNLTLSVARTQRLQQLCQSHQLTPNTWIQGAWALLLSRYSGNRDVLFGVTVAGRPTALAGVEEMVGLFINSLPLRVDVDPERPVIDWLQGLLSHNAELRDHEYAPLVDIQRNSDIPRGQQLFDSLVVFENAPLDVASVRLDGFSIDIYEDRVHTNFPMTVVLYPGDRLGIRLSYDQGRFTPDSVERMLGHLAHLLGEMLDQPEAALGQLQMLPEAERQQLLVEWNRSAVDFPLSCSYAELFGDQVRAHPQRLAAVCADDRLSYAELDQRSNAIAHALQQAGAGPDTLVALAAERGLTLLCMMIATLKAGAAFQALDIQHPPQRLGELLDLSAAPLLLVDEKASGLLDTMLKNVTRQPTSLIAQELWHADVQPVQYTHRPDQLAYVIFTSGSTGTPKGALVEQRGMLNNIFGKVPTLGLCNEDRIAQTASSAFDISVWQFLAAPIIGATVHILPDAVAHDPAALLDAIETQHLSLLEAVPTLIRGLLQEAGPQHQLGSLRWLLPTGEALPPALARDWHSRFPGTPLMNAYGPAECSDDVAFHAIHEVPEGDCAHMPIGRPTANNQLYILDADLRPQPIGVPGELCVAGVGVGRGYLGDAERTRAAFIDHPFEPGARFYRTGDIGRYRTDGVIEYLGRRDQQVKIRGHRIELGEIENRLMRHPQVDSAAVLALPDARGDLQLLACYVYRDAAPDAATAQALLVEHLRGQLASYMVPGHWRHLERLPLNANGKVDRRALAALGLPSEATALAQVTPRTPTEQALAELWQDLLGLTSLSVDDDFFALGGHSLLATQVIARIRRRLAVDLPLRALFEHRTVAELAKVVEAQAPSASAVEEIVAVPREQALHLSYAQQRLWFLDKLEGPSAAYNLSTAVRLDGELDVEALRAALQHVLDRHESLRTGFTLEGDTPRQIIANNVRLELPVQTLQAEDDGQLQQCIDEEAARPFDLQRPPMLRARLLRLGQTSHVLQFTLHHIATDAWSMGILVEEAIAAYSAYHAGQQPALTPLPIQYADYAHWQRSAVQQRRLARDIDFWRGQLQGAPTLLRLPLDKPRPAQADYHGAALRQTLSKAQAERLQGYAQAQHATLFMVLLNAFNCLLQRATGDDDFLVGTDLANREQPALEQLIGFFVNVLPLRARLDATQDFTARLHRLRDDTLAAFQHQQVPFDKLVETLQPPRQAGVNPLVQALFVLQNTPRSSAELPDLRVEHLAPRQETSKFDLALFAEEDDQGLTLRWVYRTSLFQAETIEHLQRGLDELLQRVIQAPENALQGWDWRLRNPAAMENDPVTDASVSDETSRASRKLSKLSKLKQTRAIAVSQRPEEQVRSTPLAAERALPLLIEPRLGELDPVSWAQQARGWIEEQLRRHGGLLFRGFDLSDASAFEHFAQAIEPDLYGTYGDLPKNNSGKNIYHSTPYPEQHMILFHNESSHLAQWPRKQWFYCEKPAPQGGCTPIVDCREVLARLPQPIVEALRSKGLLYVRHFTDKLDVRWQDFFKTEHREEVEQRCREADTQWQWLGEDGLRIAQRCPAIVTHPDTGEDSFFNQVQLHHPACLEPEVRRNLLELFGPEQLPRNVCYGDGSPIEDEVMDEIGRVYETCAVRFTWQKGDVVMLDNMLVAHARDPFQGERKICVAMGQMMRRDELDALTEGATHPDLALEESL